MTVGKNGRIALKWAGYIGLLFICLGLQSQQSLLNIAGVKPVLLTAVAVSLSFFEDELTAAFFGLGTGLLWDVAAGKIFGFYGMVLMVCCAATALLSIYIVKVNIVNAVAFCLAALFCCLCWDFLFYHLIWGREDVWLIFKKYLLVLVYSCIFIPGVYFLVRKLAGVPGQQLRV